MAALLTLCCVTILSTATALPYIQQDFIQRRPADVRNHSRVLIIGAGPSGVAAASRLMENGLYDVTVLEAENRIGGRIHTVRFAENIVDLGAEWVHGEKGNVVFEMAAPLDLLNTGRVSIETSMQFVWSGGALVDQEDIAALMEISKDIRHEEYDQLRNFSGSYGEWFLDHFARRLLTLERRPSPDVVERFLVWFEKYNAFYDGADTWFNTSGKSVTVYRECEGNLAISWKRNGYWSVFDLLTKRFPNPSQELPVRQRVLLQSEVATIHWGDRVYGSHNEVTERDQGDVGNAPSASKPPVVVELSNGARYTADMVLVTVSLGVLKHSAATMFDPPLYQRKLNAIQNIGFGQVDKLFMYFSEPWWPSNMSGYSALVTEQDLQEFERKYPQYKAEGNWVQGLSGFYIDSHKPNVVLFDWIVGEPARKMEMYSDYQVMLGCKLWLDMYLGQNFSIPMPIGFTRSKWWSNPHFRGSYSYRSLDSDRSDAWAAHLAEPILDDEGKPAVMFAGEATHDYYYSTVHGAIETGWREADRILSALNMQEAVQSTIGPTDPIGSTILIGRYDSGRETNYGDGNNRHFGRSYTDGEAESFYFESTGTSLMKRAVCD